jgi:hypothetical protein
MPSPPAEGTGSTKSLGLQLNEALSRAGLSCDWHTVTDRSVLVATAGSMRPMCVTITSCRLVEMTPAVVIIRFGVQPRAFIGCGDALDEILEIELSRSNSGTLAWFAIVKEPSGKFSSVPLAEVQF